MTRSDLSVLLFTLFLVCSVGALSATIDSVAVVGSSSQGGEPDIFEPGEETGDAGAVDGGGAGTATTNAIDLQFCVGFLRTAPAILGVLAGLGLVVYGVKRLYNGSTAALVSAGVVPVTSFAYFVLTNCPSEGSGGGGLASGSDIFGPAGQLGTAPSVPPTVLVAGTAGVIVLAVGLLLVVTRSDQSFEAVAADDEETFDEVDTDALARSAGRAADRIEEADVPVDNAVYRAWQEMTGLLDIENPKSAPPAEFAERAIDSGFDEEQVTELTDLFRDVRYGEKDASSREARAVEIFRAIEQTSRTPIDSDESDGSTGGSED